MKIVVTGRGTSGTWAIRGVQLGEAIGARVERNAESFNGADVIVVIKRVRPEHLKPLLAARVPIVWDILDAWPQPVGNEWSRKMCMEWLRREMLLLGPSALVVSTQVMKEDCAEFGIPTLVLPHHARPDQPVNPIRERVQTVGYEGAEHYLGKWISHLHKECETLGSRFVLNPPRLSDLDIVVGLRDCAGYAPRHWKSNVKLANAQGSGTPCIMNREQGYLDTAREGVWWADDPTELRMSMWVLVDQKQRKADSEKLLASQPRLKDVAADYKRWLADVC